ncbi:DNA protecting protein DprA [Streptomyces sp. CC53]|uniref:DNA-processing protein DprA n=1 Tax=unclassified Streptomyces TaxID=2593676 RepID=UPI0008DE0AA5|nr:MULTISPECIES: DNA-processing protein DprA [unclassified Streptomyces]OII60656.1 DNA protecting protein DprA [Streptomyces sp. CC53]
MPAPDDERTARAALCRILEPGDGHGGQWLRDLGPVELLHRLTAKPYRSGSLGGASDRRIEGLLRRAARIRPRQDLESIHAAGGRFIVPGDPEWPTQLDDLGAARPLGLWIRGPHDLRRWALRSVALVGARACTPYGAHMAADLGAGLAERGWVVVSGAAAGVDAAAHRGALGAGGATIAVLACGVDVAYPRGHTALIDRIARQGLVIGELPPGDHPTPTRFILRNRVIAALTRGTVVVEAAHRSGALATARDAQRLGRHTMGVPGPATSALSAGVHELLRDGAVLVADADDVTELVGAIGDLAPARRGPVLPRDLLDPATARVLEALPPAGRPATPSDVATDAGTSVDDALGRLYELHALGHVAREGDLWRLAPAAPHHPNTRRGAP